MRLSLAMKSNDSPLHFPHRVRKDDSSKSSPKCSSTTFIAVFVSLTGITNTACGNECTDRNNTRVVDKGCWCIYKADQPKTTQTRQRHVNDTSTTAHKNRHTVRSRVHVYSTRLHCTWQSRHFARFMSLVIRILPVCNAAREISKKLRSPSQISTSIPRARIHRPRRAIIESAKNRGLGKVQKPNSEVNPLSDRCQ